MRWDVYRSRNSQFEIINDREGIDFVRNIIHRMHFPSDTGDKRKRNALRKGKQGKEIYKKDIKLDFSRNYKSGLLVGEIFRLQCFLSFYWWDKPPSIRFFVYAIRNGLLTEWTEAGCPTKNLRNKYSQFKNVAHLWSSLNHILTIDNEIIHDHPLDYVLTFPGLFLGFAQVFRNLSLRKNLIEKKKDLWMPKNWRSWAIIPEIESCTASKEFEEMNNWLENLWESYLEEEYWRGA